MSSSRLPPRSTALSVAVCLGAAALASSCNATYRAPLAKVDRELNRIPFEGPSPTCVEVHVRNGHVLVQDGDTLEGDMSIEVWADDAAEARHRAESVRLVPAVGEGGVCQLRVSHPPGAPLDSIHVRYRLRVPPSIALRVFSRSAQVAVRGYRGDIEVRSDSGEIEARPAGGTCKLVAGSGPIRLAGSFASAEITAETGDVEVTLAPTTAIELTARSQAGRVLIDMVDDCRMQLTFTTRNGALDTDFPVFWRESGSTEDNLERRFIGSVGDAEQPELVRATVVCGSAKFALRRLQRGPLPSGPR